MPGQLLKSISPDIISQLETAAANQSSQFVFRHFFARMNQGSWFQSPIPAGVNLNSSGASFASRKAGSSRFAQPSYGWKFCQLGINLKHLSSKEYKIMLERIPTYDELTDRVDLSTITEITGVPSSLDPRATTLRLISQGTVELEVTCLTASQAIEWVGGLKKLVEGSFTNEVVENVQEAQKVVRKLGLELIT